MSEHKVPQLSLSRLSLFAKLSFSGLSLFAITFLSGYTMHMYIYIYKLAEHRDANGHQAESAPQLSIARLSHFATIFFLDIYIYMCVCVSEYTCRHLPTFQHF